MVYLTRSKELMVVNDEGSTQKGMRVVTLVTNVTTRDSACTLPNPQDIPSPLMPGDMGTEVL